MGTCNSCLTRSTFYMPTSRFPRRPMGTHCRISDRPSTRFGVGMGYAALCLLIVYACAVAGCDAGDPSVAPVSGAVSVKGQPLKLGRVCFYPERGRPAIGKIGA